MLFGYLSKNIQIRINILLPSIQRTSFDDLQMNMIGHIFFVSLVGGIPYAQVLCLADWLTHLDLPADMNCRVNVELAYVITLTVGDLHVSILITSIACTQLCYLACYC